MLLRFAGFHRRPSSSLLRGLLYLEVCKSRNASGIELKITTFWKWLSYILLELFSFFGGQKIYFVSCISHRLQPQHISTQASQKFDMRDFVASTQAFIAEVGIACEHWCSYIKRHRTLLCVLLTHVWKPAFTVKSISNVAIYTTINCQSLLVAWSLYKLWMFEQVLLTTSCDKINV